jgi:hypothetical protein
MGRIGGFIGSSSAGRGPSSYRIPQAEQAIHRRVLDEGLAIDRADAWRDGLGTRERVVIEQLCDREMQARGYARDPKLPLVGRLAATTRELLRSGWRISREFGSRALAKGGLNHRD